jgi:hypothetical protein
VKPGATRHSVKFSPCSETCVASPLALPGALPTPLARIRCPDFPPAQPLAQLGQRSSSSPANIIIHRELKYQTAGSRDVMGESGAGSSAVGTGQKRNNNNARTAHIRMRSSLPHSISGPKNLMTVLNTRHCESGMRPKPSWSGKYPRIGRSVEPDSTAADHER